MKSTKATALTVPTPSRGYARNQAEEAKLKSWGVKVVYRADKGETIGKFRMRSGETLAVTGGLRVFGETRGLMNEAVKAIKACGAVILDIDSGLRSDTDGVEMLHTALLPPVMTPDFLAAMQKASVEARIKGRMPESKARRIWFDGRYSVAEKLELMTKWSRRAAYATFGKTDAGVGRRSK